MTDSDVEEKDRSVETGEIWGLFQWDDIGNEWERLEKAESLMHLVAKTIHTGYGYAGETASAIKRNKDGEWETVAKIFPHLNQGARVSWYKDVVNIEEAEKSKPVETFPDGDER